MDKFRPASLPHDAFDPLKVSAKFGVSLSVAREVVEKNKRESIYMNDRYQVNVSAVMTPFGPENGNMVHLSIKRRNKAPIHDWRELQKIKNEIVGPENVGFEVYPAESNLVDTANQYHLWVFIDPKVRLPVGLGNERVVSNSAQAAMVGAVQRPLSL